MTLGRHTNSKIREVSLLNMLLKSRKTVVFCTVFRVQGSAVHATQMWWGAKGHEVVGTMWFTGSLHQGVT